MAITTRSEYGMRAMLLLAEQVDDELLSTTELARRALIPRKYLEQILRDLKQAGLVISHAGVHGGYRLSRAPAQITAGEVVRCLDQVDVMGCVSAEPQAPCEQRRGCSLRPLWQRLQSAIQDVLDSTTLDQLAVTPCLASIPVRPAVVRDEAPDDDAVSTQTMYVI